jgi:hypothetical protein
MKRKKTIQGTDIQDVAGLKKQVIAHAIATGNTFAFHDLFAQIKEFGDAEGGGLTRALLDKLAYLLPTEEIVDSPEYAAAMELVEQHEFEENFIPAAIIEATAKRAVIRGNFAYAEDAYRLLGIKKEIVALYAQSGERLLREDKPRHAATAFHVAASLEQPRGPHYQYLGSQLHEACLNVPEKCVTMLEDDALVGAGIRFLLSNEVLADRLAEAVREEQKKEVLATLAVISDLDFSGLLKNLREAVDAASGLEDGKPDDYSPIAQALLGRTCETGEWWQYLREFSFEHPLGALCVCVKLVKRTPVLVPAIRDGKSIIESLLPPRYLNI